MKRVKAKAANLVYRLIVASQPTDDEPLPERGAVSVM